MIRIDTACRRALRLNPGLRDPPAPCHVRPMVRVGVCTHARLRLSPWSIFRNRLRTVSATREVHSSP